ncbi:MAG: hypothetical protein MK358_12670, partial [Vicinamibacterales bacterium]|nr:hypothetical protein [Vicinamibacterales bacterium]
KPLSRWSAGLKRGGVRLRRYPPQSTCAKATEASKTATSIEAMRVVHRGDVHIALHAGRLVAAIGQSVTQLADA